MADRPRRARRALDLATVGLFAGVLGAPALDRCLRPDEARDTMPEKRAPSPWPARPATWREITRWPRHFEAWHDDVLGLRDVLLGARNSALVAARTAPTPLLDIGESGWIFYKGDRSFEAHRGTYTLDRHLADAWVDALADRHARLAACGVRFVFAFVPDKETVYPELLPATWRPLGPNMSDLFLAELARRTDVEFLDLRPVLLAAKQADRPAADDFAYFARGTHWSSRGALAGCAAIFDHLRAAFPALPAFDADDFEDQMRDATGEDSWARDLYAPWRLAPSHMPVGRGGWKVSPGLAPKRPGESAITVSGDAALPSIHFLHDSHGPFLLPYLAQGARRLRSTWRTSIDDVTVDVEQPDVVLMIRAERMLSFPPDRDERTSGASAPAALGPESAAWSLARADPPPAIVGAATLDTTDAGSAWTTRARDDRFEVDLRGVVRGPGRWAIVLDVDAPQRGHIDLFTGASGGASWTAEGRLRLVALAGRNEHVLVVPAAVTLERLVVHCGPAGTWRFRRLELHALGAGGG